MFWIKGRSIFSCFFYNLFCFFQEDCFKNVHRCTNQSPAWGRGTHRDLWDQHRRGVQGQADRGGGQHELPGWFLFNDKGWRIIINEAPPYSLITAKTSLEYMLIITQFMLWVVLSYEVLKPINVMSDDTEWKHSMHVRFKGTALSFSVTFLRLILFLWRVFLQINI